MNETHDSDPRAALSAWMDGALAADEARFLQRRLDHDPALRAQWERWQLAAAVLRGQRVRTTDVAAAVAAGVEVAAREVAAVNAAANGRPRRGAWPWLATAAAVALAAVLWPNGTGQDPALRPGTVAGDALPAPALADATVAPASPRPARASTPTPLLPAAEVEPAPLADISELPLAEGLPLRAWPRSFAPAAPAAAGAVVRLPPPPEPREAVAAPKRRE